MNRRSFGKLAVASLAVPRAFPSQPQSARSGKIKLGTQHDSTDDTLRASAAFGVTHICSQLPSAKFDEHWSVEGLSQLRERIESFGIRLEAVPLPLSSVPIARAENPAILLGKSPERDREIDQICQMIENCARAGIPMVKYNFNLLGVPRTGRVPGRSGASYSAFDYSKERQDLTLTEAGRVTSEMMWERISYFLNRVVPVAESNKVKIACHPHDPAMPASGFLGVQRVLGSVEGLKRLIEIHPSPYHGLNFCQGSVSEMLRDPGREIFDVIRYFGTRKKIFNVHLRNIRGGFLHFEETFPDAGDVDMLAALRVYKEVGYAGMIMPDHVPRIEGDLHGRQAFAFAFGYMRGLLQALNA